MMSTIMSSTLPTRGVFPSQPIKIIVTFILLSLIYIISQAFPDQTGIFPTDWNLGLREPIDQFQDWLIRNRSTYPLFAYTIDPIRSGVDIAVRGLETGLAALPWVVLVSVFGLAGYVLSGWRLALGSALSLFICGLFGLWLPSLQTLALMSFSVLLSLAIGITIGVLCALNNRLERALSPILDAMQTMPAFVYLIPVVLFFGVARVPAVIATIIYAVPPVIRLVNLGIREVQPAAVEAGRAFGGTRWQLLTKVQLPLALPAILAGVNQTIMMALGMVVIAAMVGASGLGREVFLALQRLKVGQAFEAGLAIVLLAIMLDRLSEALGNIDLTASRDPSPQAWRRRWAVPLGLMGLVLAAALVLPREFPESWQIGIRDGVDVAIAWLRDHATALTDPLNEGLINYLLNPMRELLWTILPWPVTIAIVAAIAYFVGNWRLAVGSAIGLFFIGLFGMWEQSMETLSQILVTTFVTMLLAIPIGVLASQYDTVRRVLRPMLDFLQTVPTFVYLVPVIMLFDVGRVPGLIASVLYAIPVGIKLTDLGIRQVEPATVEAARAFGSTRLQTIRKVQLPLARTAIALSINQMIMMVLAMVIISGMVGGAGLGLEAITGMARSQTGQGIEAGLAIVILAIIMDRITQAWAMERRHP
ncbi:MAG: ABC transporter permease subunit [Chloroflexi bacterium]|nr:ABC transporter permease subunit [Chloroflexota bacterium]